MMPYNIKSGNDNLGEIAEIINRVGYKEWLSDGRYIEDPKILKDDDIMYYLLRYSNDTMGFCAFKKHNDLISSIDIAFLEKYRGKLAKYMSMVAIKKYIIDTKCGMLITRVNKKNRRSLFFSKWLGFVKYLEDNDYIYLRLILWVA